MARTFRGTVEVTFLDETGEDDGLTVEFGYEYADYPQTRDSPAETDIDFWFLDKELEKTFELTDAQEREVEEAVLAAVEDSLSAYEDAMEARYDREREYDA